MSNERMRGHLATMFPSECVPGLRYAPGKDLNSMHVVQLKQHEIELVVQFMQQTCGNDLSDKTALVSSKMSALCTQLGYRHFYELWDTVKGTSIASARLRQKVIDELTTSYSYFYREDTHFKRLSELVASGDLPVDEGALRVWSAGCASGEEVYNIAMALEDARRGGLLAGQYQIVGSDISSYAINAALESRYDIADVARMPPHWRNLYCMRSGQEYEIKGELRNHVEFRLENVLTPRPDIPFDVVMCRNMMIYFDKDSIDLFCTLLQGRVKPGGYLFLGHAEIISNLPGFTYVEPSLWRRNPADANSLFFGI